jgi:hypothetical protein
LRRRRVRRDPRKENVMKSQIRKSLFVVSATFMLVFALTDGWIIGAPAAAALVIQGDPKCEEKFPSAEPPDPRATVVMCGLDNPRGLAFSQFALYVAEAGRGGLGLSTTDCFTGQAGGFRCYGPSGAISRLFNGVQERIATGFPSHASVGGFSAIGPNDIGVVPETAATIGLELPAGSSECAPGCAFVTIGLQQPPRFRETFPFLRDFAKLVRIAATGDWSYVADLGAYEARVDPDHDFYNPDKLDTNPYGLSAEPSGRGVVLTDAGGNSILRVATGGKVSGSISTVAALPPHPDDAVPTSVTVGPDGAYYVGELSGFPPVAGAANIIRIGHPSDAPTVCLSGFTLIIDIAFDKLGNLYVLQYSGSLIHIAPDRSAMAAVPADNVLCARYAAGERTTVITGLTNPTSVEVGSDGAIYISNRGTAPARVVGGQVIGGQVIRFEL